MDKFLANQRDIQQEYPGAELVFAVNEADFVEELKQLIKSFGEKGGVAFGWQYGARYDDRLQKEVPLKH
jgi:hypothetical protein